MQGYRKREGRRANSRRIMAGGGQLVEGREGKGVGEEDGRAERKRK